MAKLIIALSVIAAGFLLTLVVRYHMKKVRRKHLLKTPLSKDFKQIIEKNIPLYRKLPAELKDQLHGRINIFLAEKTFTGCGGLKITDEMKVTIASQACMLLLNRKIAFHKPSEILVYPHTYVAPTKSYSAGIITEENSERLGESWQRGPVVLAWDSIQGGASNITDGQNVVLHEFSHQLDQEDGAADGAPVLESRSCYASWATIFSHEFEKLRKQHTKTVLHKYGRTNPAEFFAVATEAFFEKPRQMKKKHAELYEELQKYYKLDPAGWH